MKLRKQARLRRGWYPGETYTHEDDDTLLICSIQGIFTGYGSSSISYPGIRLWKRGANTAVAASFNESGLPGKDTR
jgi:hypothetical protein